MGVITVTWKSYFQNLESKFLHLFKATLQKEAWDVYMFSINLIGVTSQIY